MTTWFASGNRRDTTLRERDVDSGIRIQQQPQVVPCTVRHPLFDRHSRSRQDFDVTLRIAMRQAVFQPRCQDDATRWSRFQVVHGRPHHADD